MNLSAPERPRDTFELFRNYDEELGLAALLDRINWQAITPLQIYSGLLGRLPEGAKLAVPEGVILAVALPSGP